MKFDFAYTIVRGTVSANEFLSNEDIEGYLEVNIAQFNSSIQAGKIEYDL